MDITQARKIVSDFERKPEPNEDDVFMYTEALDYLIRETGNPHYMVRLGGFYYGEKHFDLAEKYYLLADEYNYEEAAACLGYIYYYGRTGEKDYEKAFKYYSRSADLGNPQSAYKVADMFRNGYAVEKDFDKFASIVKGLWNKRSSDGYIQYLTPEIASRMGMIKEHEGKNKDAYDFYKLAKRSLVRRLKDDGFFGNFTIMSMLIDNIHRVHEVSPEEFDFYDLYVLLKTPSSWKVVLFGKEYIITSEQEDGGITVACDGKYYRNISDFITGGTVEDMKLFRVADRIKAVSKVNKEGES